MPMRWRCPPEKACGIAAHGVARQSDLAHLGGDAGLRSTAAQRVALCQIENGQGSAMMSRTRWRGLRLLNGSWNTTCTRRRSCRKAGLQRPIPKEAAKVVDVVTPSSHDLARRSARAGAGWSCRAWICRSRSRPRWTGSRRVGEGEGLTPSSAWTTPTLRAAEEAGFAAGKCFL